MADEKTSTGTSKTTESTAISNSIILNFNTKVNTQSKNISTFAMSDNIDKLKATLEKAVAQYNEAYGAYDEETKSEMVNEEIVARFIETTLSEPKRLLDEIDGNTSLIGRIKDILKSFVSQQDKLTQSDKTLVNKAYNAFKSAIETKKTDKRNYTMSANAKGALQGATQWSIKNGIVFIDTDQDIFDGVEDVKERRKIAREYILKIFRSNSYYTTDNKLVIFTRKSAKKVENTSNIVKIRITTELDNLLATAKFWKTEPNIKDVNKEFGNFDYYNAKFILDGLEFDCILNIGINTKEKLGVFYDVTNIREKVSVNSLEKNSLLHQTDTSSTSIIRNSNEKVNTQNENILESGKNDNTQYSLSDSKGRTLTQEQAEFFKDSKVRDNEGNLLVVYHGTDQKFNVFDITKSRSYDERINYDLPGFYFSQSNDDSGAYGNTKKYYIDIKNPYKGNDYTLQKEKGSYRKAYDYLVEQGYDGMIIEEGGEGGNEYIVFTPNQIKLIENKAPTKKDDIRYSLSDIDKYGETEYNYYGWVVVNDVLSSGIAKSDTAKGVFGEYKQFSIKFNEAKLNKYNLSHKINSQGEYMISVENKLVFAKGDADSPIISKIVEIDAKDGDELTEILSLIYIAEKEGDNYEEWNKVIKSFNGQKCAICNYKKDFPTYGRLKRRASLSPKDNTSYWNGKPKGYNFEESDGSGASGRIKGKKQFSVADTYSAKKAYTQNEMKAVVENITAFGVFGDELAKIAKGKTVRRLLLKLLRYRK